jgi:type IV pilus assembly protein PilN
MAQINLLPWREDLRKQNQLEFMIMLVIGVIVAIAIMAATHFTYSGMIENQENRNRFLKNEISALDKKIKEIKALEKTKNKLIARMEVIQRLQSSRSEIVHMFDQLARTVPEGVHLTNFTQKGKQLAITGNAQSNARVSAYMHSLERSPWLKGTDLSVIKSRTLGVNGFALKVNQSKVESTQEEK